MEGGSGNCSVEFLPTFSISACLSVISAPAGDSEIQV